MLCRTAPALPSWEGAAVEVMDAGGGHPRVLCDRTSGPVAEPACSPTGDQIVFSDAGVFRIIGMVSSRARCGSCIRTAPASGG
jgi:hypothetical protein